MSYEVLARKWRPQVFQDVVGQEHISQTLINAVKNGRVAHAYLFSGPRGIGKTSVARILAKAINCEKGEPGVPCNRCTSCVEITEGSSVDVQEIDGASNRGIDEIRELREYLKYMPSSSSYRIYIIDEVHMLTRDAFNALLKSLEEPPEHVKFIFATTEANKVPPTILSRCQRFDFKRIPQNKIVAHLEKITREEGIEISTAALGIIAREAEGGMRDAQSLLDQIVSFSGSRVDLHDVNDILGIIDSAVISETTQAVIEGSAEKCLEIVEKIYAQGYDIRHFYGALMRRFRHLLVSLLAPGMDIPELTEDERLEIHRQAKKGGQQRLHVLLNTMINREETLRYSPHPRLILETILVKLCRIDELLSFSELLERIASLEERLLPSGAPADPSETGRVSEPAGQWSENDQQTEERSRDIQGERPREDKTWDQFLAYVASRNPAASRILGDWVFLKLEGKTLVLGRSPHGFSSSYFDDPDKLKELSEYCREFYERDIRLQFREAKNRKTASQKTLSTDNEKSPAGPDGARDLPPPIQEMIHTFQGEIVKVHGGADEALPDVRPDQRKQEEVEG